MQHFNPSPQISAFIFFFWAWCSCSPAELDKQRHTPSTDHTSFPSGRSGSSMSFETCVLLHTTKVLWLCISRRGLFWPHVKVITVMVVISKSYRNAHFFSFFKSLIANYLKAKKWKNKSIHFLLPANFWNTIRKSLDGLNVQT